MQTSHSFSESAEDDWYFQLTGAYDDGFDNIKPDNGNTMASVNTKLKQETKQEYASVNGETDTTKTLESYQSQRTCNTSEKNSVTHLGCLGMTREERIRQLKNLLEQQEEAVTKLKSQSEFPSEIGQNIPGEEIWTSVRTEERLRKTVARRNAEIKSGLVVENCSANEGSRYKGVLFSQNNRDKKCDASVQVDMDAECSNEFQITSTVEQDGTRRKARKIGRVKRSLGKVQNRATESTRSKTEEQSKGSVCNGEKRQAGKKRRSFDVNQNRRSLQSTNSRKRRKKNNSRKSPATYNTQRDKIEQLMKKEERSCEDFMFIMGLARVTKNL